MVYDGGITEKLPSLFCKNLPQHDAERIRQLEDFFDLRLHGLSGRAAELVLLLHPASSFGIDWVEIVLFIEFLRVLRFVVRNSKVFQVALDRKLES